MLQRALLFIFFLFIGLLVGNERAYTHHGPGRDVASALMAPTACSDVKILAFSCDILKIVPMFSTTMYCTFEADKRLLAVFLSPKRVLFF